MPALDSNSRLWRGVCLVLSIALGFEILQSSWLSDDFLIGMRQVLNGAHGFGLGFNVGERVQTMTSPLWMFVMWLAYVGGGLFYGPLLVSVGLSFAAVALLVRFTRVTGQSYAWLALLLALLVSSRSYVDFSTSGLENTLGFAILAALMLELAAFFSADLAHCGGSFARVCSLAALLVLTRYDYALLAVPLVLPAAARLAVHRRFQTLAGASLASAVPILLWFACSLVYFGSIYPNTYYAKMSTAIPLTDRLHYSQLYFVAFLKLDPIGACSIASALVVLSLRAAQDRVALGPLGAFAAYLVYLLSMGGDFMAGRFFAILVVLSVFSLAEPQTKNFRRTLAAILACACVVATPKLAALTTKLNFDAGEAPSAHWVTERIVDEKRHYLRLGQGLFAQLRPRYLGLLETWERNWIDARARYARAPAAAVVSQVVSVGCGGLGHRGLSYGPTFHLFDHCALADPFLSKLPLFAPHSGGELLGWGPGHFIRALPPGYVASFSSFGHHPGDDETAKFLPEARNRITDPDLAYVFERMRLITRGALFSRERWRAISELMSGELVRRARGARFYRREKVLRWKEASQPFFETGKSWDSKQTFDPGTPLMISLPAPVPPGFRISLDSGDVYEVAFLNGSGRAVYQTLLGPTQGQPGLTVYRVQLPAGVAAKVHSCSIKAHSGDGAYGFGGIASDSAVHD
jgi:arabinofuranosyltransferase